jgi:sugar lactone lactonase YvrE
MKSFGGIAPFAVVALAALLGSCDGSGPPSGTPESASAVASQTHEPRPSVIYGSDFLNGKVYAYSQKGHGHEALWTIQGLQPSIGLFVDERRHLYVAQTGAVVEFAPGATKPAKTYDDAGHDAAGVARCPNGTLYVANSDGATISVYANGSTEPTGILDDKGTQVFHLACDSANDVFVTVAGKAGQVDEFVAGSTEATNLPISLDFPEGIAIDRAGDVVVANAGKGAVEFFHVGSSEPFEAIAIPHVPLELSFGRNDDAVWVTTNRGLERYRLADGRRTALITTVEFAGIAASPPD